jgi:hypothetical protein
MGVRYLATKANPFEVSLYGAGLLSVNRRATLHRVRLVLF